MDQQQHDRILQQESIQTSDARISQIPSHSAIRSRNKRLTQQQYNQQNQRIINTIAFVLILLTVALFFTIKLVNNQNYIVQFFSFGLNQNAVVQKIGNFPKILWIDQQYLPAQSFIMNHYIDACKQHNYQIRFIHPLDSYQWLSNETIQIIRHSKHNSKYQIDVQQLLRIGLLYEHGGLYIRLKDMIFIENIGFLERFIINQTRKIMQNSNEKYLPQIILMKNITNKQMIYDSNILFASKKSKIFEKMIKQMPQLITKQNKQVIGVKNKDTNVEKIYNLIQIMLNRELKTAQLQQNSFADRYNIMQMDANQPQIIANINTQNFMPAILLNKIQFYNNFGQKYIIKTPSFDIIKQYIISYLNGINLYAPNQFSIFYTTILNIQGNRQILYNNQPFRKDIYFCFISLKPIQNINYALQIDKHTEYLNQQEYKRWRAIYFVKNLIVKNQSHYSSQGKAAIIVNASENEGLNLLRAATKYCRTKQIAFLLDYDEILFDKNSLTKVAYAMQYKNVYGLFLPITQKSGITFYSSYNRKNISIRNSQQLNLKIMSDIKNHFRVFTIQSYLFLPNFELHDLKGYYYNKQLPLIMMIQIFSNYEKCLNNNYRFLLQNLKKVMDVPWYIDQLNVTINVQRYNGLIAYGQQYYQKFKLCDLCSAIQYHWIGKQKPFEDDVYFNNGSQFQSLQERKVTHKAIIPKIVHQVWFGQTMPLYKQKLSSRLRQLLPEYSYLLWTQNNLTRQNFPYTYEIIQNILDFNKKSSYNKLSIISDLIRYQVIYKYGGFYVDTNYLILKQNGFDDFLTYQCVFSPYFTPNHMRIVQGGFYGAMKNYKPILNVLNHKSLNSRNIYSKQADYIFGPHYFSCMLDKNNVNNKDILILSIEYIYPYLPFGIGKSNRCIAEPTHNKQDLLLSNHFAYIKDCHKKYPNAYGIYLFDEGHILQK